MSGKVAQSYVTIADFTDLGALVHLPYMYSYLMANEGALHGRSTVSYTEAGKAPFLASFTPRAKFWQADHTCQVLHQESVEWSSRICRPHSSNDGSSVSGLHVRCSKSLDICCAQGQQDQLRIRLWELFLTLRASVSELELISVLP